jgi:thiosulfate/3-mercaptopyruvate sulfurtransferase
VPATVSAVVDADWIADHLSDETVRLVEVDVSPAAYREGHIPGALLWNIYADLRHTDYSLATATELAELLARSGIERGTTVVFYGYGAHLGFWLLRRLGHDDVRLMDGPRDQWLQTRRSWSLAAPSPSKAPSRPVSLDPRLEATYEQVIAFVGRPGQVMLDVRSDAEYAGERFWPSGATEGAGRAGHIPGSVHLPIEKLRTEDGRFRGADEMRRALLEHDVTSDRRVVPYCTIGNRASQAWFALSTLLDYPDTAVYYGSWAEWGTRPDTPIEGAGKGS